jgi:hypothetical protein
MACKPTSVHMYVVRGLKMDVGLSRAKCLVDLVLACKSWRACWNCFPQNPAKPWLVSGKLGPNTVDGRRHEAIKLTWLSVLCSLAPSVLILFLDGTSYLYKLTRLLLVRLTREFVTSRPRKENSSSVPAIVCSNSWKIKKIAHDCAGVWKMLISNPAVTWFLFFLKWGVKKTLPQSIN